MRQTVIRCLVVAACASATTAQQPDGPPTGGRRLVDQVEAVIGDHVLLQSQLRREVESRIAGREFSAEQIRALTDEVVFDLVREQIWVQYGKSLVERSPQNLDEFVEQRVDEQIAEEIRQSGSFLRYESELGLLGDSWSETRRRRRNRILEEWGRVSAVSQLARQRSLLVRPAEIREFFEAHIDQFQRPASADVSRVGFRIQGNAEDAQERATRAAEAWRAEDLAPLVVAERFQGIEMNALLRIEDTADDPRAPFLKKFAAEHPAGFVSEPIQRGNFFLLLRVETKREAKTATFDDPDVQATIRNKLAEQRIDARQDQVMRSKAREIYVWPPALGRRISG
ncbi:MAG: peptidyl-prolyl cis-trans isomerase [Planctomycetes bacterium]|nr:peptidyl-prolyl cis-trans isomerase [Planctomycetota bacterium]